MALNLVHFSDLCWQQHSQLRDTSIFHPMSAAWLAVADACAEGRGDAQKAANARSEDGLLCS